MSALGTTTHVCSFCAAEFRGGDPARVAAEHVLVCEEHPLGRVFRAAEALVERFEPGGSILEIDRLREVVAAVGGATGLARAASRLPAISAAAFDALSYFRGRPGTARDLRIARALADALGVPL